MIIQRTSCGTIMRVRSRNKLALAVDWTVTQQAHADALVDRTRPLIDDLNDYLPETGS
jgi:hypothetical protein